MLFPPPKQEFASTLEVVTNCRAKTVAPVMQSKLKVSVHFDNDTPKANVKNFKDEITKNFTNFGKA